MELLDAGVNGSGLILLAYFTGLLGNGRLQSEPTSNPESDTNLPRQSTQLSTSIPIAILPPKDGASKSF